MNFMAARWLGVTVVTAVVSVGCAKKPPPVSSSHTNSDREQSASSEAAVRVQTLARLADQYARQARELPGGEYDYRRLMSGVFARLSEILPVLYGPNRTRMFEQQLQIIQNSARELSGTSSALSPEPTVATGLRAAYDALAALARDSFNGQPDLAATLDKLQAKENELDEVHGPLSRITAAEAVDLSSEAITKMANLLGQRLAEQKGMPAEAPTSIPGATEPTEAPPPANEPAPATTEPAPPATAPAPAATEPAPAEPPASEPAASQPAATEPTPQTAPAGQ